MDQKIKKSKDRFSLFSHKIINEKDKNSKKMRKRADSVTITNLRLKSEIKHSSKSNTSSKLITPNTSVPEIEVSAPGYMSS